MRPRVEGTGEGEGLTAGCRDWVRGEKALPFLRADFQDNLSPREREEDKSYQHDKISQAYLILLCPKLRIGFQD